MGILAWIVFGLVIGLIARALLPGRQSMGIVMTILLGVAGSLIGGFIASALGGGDARGFTPAGMIGSVLGAIALLLLFGAVTRPRRRVA